MHTCTCTYKYAYLHTHTGARQYTQTCTNTRIHTIYTSNLLVMRSVLSLELREKREDEKERRKKDERRGGQQRKSHVMFSQWRSGCVWVTDHLICITSDTHFFMYPKKVLHLLYSFLCFGHTNGHICVSIIFYFFVVCMLTDRVKYRCDEQMFSPEELAIHIPGGTIREEPLGVTNETYNVFLLYFGKNAHIFEYIHFVEPLLFYPFYLSVYWSMRNFENCM